MAVPLVISDTSGVSSQRRTGNKSVMMELLSSGTARPRVTPIAGRRLISRDGCFLPFIFTPGQNELQAVVDESLDIKEA